MSDGYGKLILLLLAIGMIWLASSGKGRQVINVLTGNVVGSAPSIPNTNGMPLPSQINPPTSGQKIPKPNPTDLETGGGSLA